MNNVSFKSANMTQQVKVKKETSLPKKAEITKDVDTKKSNTAKLMIGATAVAAVVIAGVLLHKGAARKAAKAVVDIDYHSGVAESTHIKQTPASRSTEAMIRRVDELKAREKSPVKRNPYESMDWDAEPISRTQAIFEHKFPQQARDYYINPAIGEKFESLEKQGYKINVENQKDGYTKITYIYPENSPIESKTVYGKVADLDKGYKSGEDASKEITISLKEHAKNLDANDTYIFKCSNHPYQGDAPYQFSSFNCAGGLAASNRGSLDKETLFKKYIMPATEFFNNDDVSSLLKYEFKNALGIV